MILIIVYILELNMVHRNFVIMRTVLLVHNITVIPGEILLFSPVNKVPAKKFYFLDFTFFAATFLDALLLEPAA